MFKVTLCHGKKRKKNKKCSTPISVSWIPPQSEWIVKILVNSCKSSLIAHADAVCYVCITLAQSHATIYTNNSMCIQWQYCQSYNKLHNLFVKYTPASADLPPQPLTRGFATEPQWGHGSHPRPPLLLYLFIMPNGIIDSCCHARHDSPALLLLHWLPEADLGMFSMFGRTGAPTKKGPPQEDLQIFATEQHAGNNRHNNKKTILYGVLAS